MVHARYDAIADFYVAGFDSVDDPASRAILDLVGPVAGLDVLDVACGHGRITRELARRGANVLGVDISAKLISHALVAERTEPLGIGYHRANVSAVGSLRTDAFDLVVCHFGLSDIDDLDGAVAAISAALRRDGRFVFSILHPCFGGGKDIASSWPTAGSYYDEGHWTAHLARSTLRRQVGAHHRMLSTYFGSLRRAGLWLDAVSEPRPAPGWDPAHDADRKPVHLVVRAVKPG
jgi:2-polyprenyl-3-methyl-5-hydroxy-6-metoxy-1,4-benzoquinol methylase